MQSMSRHKAVFAILVALLGGGCAPEPPSGTYRDVEEEWLPKWSWAGPGFSQIEAALDNMKSSTAPRRNPEQYDTVTQYGPGHWVYEFVVLGDAAMSKALALEAAGEVDAAREAFMEASSFYQIGKFPYTRDGDWEYYRASYEQSMEAYERAGRLFETPLETVELPYQGGIIRGYLHLPAPSFEVPYPLVIASGGIDVFKVENYPLAKLMNEKGVAVVVLDIPGVGESNFVPSEPTHDQVFRDMLTLLERDPRIDASRAAVFATSFGGNAAARVAFTDERFVAVVAACAPVHDAFNQPVWAIRLAPASLVMSVMERLISPLRLDVLADRLGFSLPLREADYTEYAVRSAGFSLVDQGLVSTGKKTKVPLLVINTTDDDIAPPSDMELLAASAETSEVIYMGEGGHCGDKDTMVSLMVPWLEPYLLPVEK
jgi:esterase FrsA